MLVTHLVTDAKSSGSLPTWRKERFGDVCSIYRGGSPRPIQHYITTHSDGINWIKIGDIGIGAKYIDSTEEKITQAGATRSRSVRCGDFLLSNSMSFGRPYILRTDGCIHDGWLTIQDYKRDFETEFLYYYLSSEEVASQYRRYAAGSGVQNLNKEVVSNIDVFIPPIPEQRAIAEALGDVDELIGRLERLIAKKRDIKQAVMQQLLTGKTRLPGFTGEWKRVQLRSLGGTYGGLTGKSKQDFGSGNAQYVTFMNVMTNPVIRLDQLESVSVRASENQNQVRKGDLLFNGSSETPEEVAYCALVQDECGEVYLNSFCFGFRPFDSASFDAYFLTALIRSSVGREVMKSLAQGSTRYNISKAALKQGWLSMPPVDEQKAIAQVVKDFDSEIDALLTRLSKTRDIKQGMMQQLLTGKVRLV